MLCAEDRQHAFLLGTQFAEEGNSDAAIIMHFVKAMDEGLSNNPAEYRGAVSIHLGYHWADGLMYFEPTGRLQVGVLDSLNWDRGLAKLLTALDRFVRLVHNSPQSLPVIAPPSFVAKARAWSAALQSKLANLFCARLARGRVASFCRVAEAMNRALWYAHMEAAAGAPSLISALLNIAFEYLGSDVKGLPLFDKLQLVSEEQKESWECGLPGLFKLPAFWMGHNPKLLLDLGNVELLFL